MTIGSLFSGIGGLELGLERAGLGPVLWQVEIDPWCRRVLAKHWPDAERFEDVRQVRGIHREDCDPDHDCSCGALQPVDILCGGFPCQDISDSQGASLAGARSGLWFEMLRIVRELRPRHVVVENVSNLSTRGLDVVLGGLAESGYDAAWLPIRAADVGSPHRRPRIFVLAHANADGREPEPPPRLHVQGPPRDDTHRRGSFPPGRDADAATWRAYASTGGPEPAIRRGVDGFPSRLDRRRLAALGNAVVVDCAELVGHMIQMWTPGLRWIPDDQSAWLDKDYAQ